MPSFNWWASVICLRRFENKAALLLLECASMYYSVTEAGLGMKCFSKFSTDGGLQKVMDSVAEQRETNVVLSVTETGIGLIIPVVLVSTAFLHWGHRF